MSLRFVILHHTGVAEPHFDLMFETAPGSPLATWRSPAWPISSPTHIIRLPDHRPAYLDYEGPVSQNRGHVTRVLAGTFAWISQSPSLWTIRLSDNTTLTFRQISGDEWQVEIEVVNHNSRLSS